MTTPTQTTFGECLRDWRGRRGMSQLHLALAANVSQRHISFLESGRAQPSRPMVLVLADAMSMPLAERNNILNAAGFAPSTGRAHLTTPPFGMFARRLISCLISTCLTLQC